MQKLLVLLFLLFGTALSQQVYSGFGANWTAQANTVTTINAIPVITGVGLSFDIFTNADAQVSITVVNDVSASLPSGYTNNTFTTAGSVMTGFVVNVYPSSAFVNATLSTGVLLATAFKANAIASGKALGLLYVNSSSTVSTFVDVDLNIAGSAGLQANLPFSGTYVFSYVSFEARVPTYYGWAKKLVSNQLRRLWYQSELLLSVTASSNTSVSVTKQSSNPKSDPPAVWVSTGIWFNIELDAASTLNATISYTFNEAKWATLNVSRLAIGYFNTTANNVGSWVFQSTSVNVSARAVSTTTTHFSTWGVYQDNSTEATSAGMTASSAGMTGSSSGMMASSAKVATSAITNADNSASSVVGIAFATLFVALLL